MSFSTDAGKIMFRGRHSSKTKKKISDANSGENNPMYGKTGGLHPWFGKHHSLKAIRSMSNSKLGKKNPNYGKHLSVSARGKVAEFRTGKHHSQTTIDKMSRSLERLWRDPVYARKVSLHSKKMWKDPEYARKVLAADHGSSPNKMELVIGGILDSLFPALFRYVGNGELIVEGKCPDFMSVDDSKLLIEFNGEYWHRGENTRTRARHFAKYGYRTLFIWTKELRKRNRVRLEKKIVRFVEKYRG